MGGAGVAGAAAAGMLAEAGFRVALFDARQLDRAGPRWVNGVPAWLFDEARVPRPAAPELLEANPTFTMLCRDGHRHVEEARRSCR